MIRPVREMFNAGFSQAGYQRVLAMFDQAHAGALDYRIAETPVFLGKQFADRVIEAGENILSSLLHTDFKSLTAEAVPPGLSVPGRVGRCEVMCFDFAICMDENGVAVPQLIEMQGFPTVFYAQELLARAYRRCYDIPAGFDNYFNGYDHERYKALLRGMILGGYPAENVVLLEVNPHAQRTRIDFYLTQDYTGVRPVCISELMRQGNQLYYLRDGKKTLIKRIYNRLIASDLESQRHQLPSFVDITGGFDVEWFPHPNWFYRISKYTMPFLQSAYVPETHFLHKVRNVPADLENYVLKPLFSFAGQGVIMDVQAHDLAAIAHPEQWILQRKVAYAPVIDTPTGPAHCELRLMYCWERGAPRPVLVNNMIRIGKTDRIGVRHHGDSDWVGVSIGFFEKG